MKTLLCQCPKCGKDFEGHKRKRFCSRGCANSRVWDEEKKAKHSLIAKAHRPPKYEQRTCPCGKSFQTKPFLKKKHCCFDCSAKYVKRPTGGYREGSGRSKSGYFRGIYCGSTYELCWVIHQLDKGIPFKRFDGLLKKGDLKYFPDFLVGEKQIIEIKGYWTPAVDYKTEMAKSLGYSVQVLYKEDLKEAFEHVEKKHGTKKFHTLYDSYKPTYTGTCFNCGKEFSRDRRPSAKQVFCSRVCCGKFRKSQNTPCR